MKTFFKIAGAALVVIVIVLAAALAVLQQMYPPERIRSLVLAQLQDQLHREVRLKHAAIGMTGLSLDGLEISEAPDFRAGTMAEADTIRIEPRLAPLLRKHLEIYDVLLSGWRCRVVRHRNGAWNFETPAPAAQEPARPNPNASHAPQAAQKAEEAPSAPPGLERSWEVGRIRIESGSLSYVDESAPASELRIREIHFSAGRVRPKGAFPIEASADYAGSGFHGVFQLSASIDLGGFQPDQMSAKWSSLKLRHQGLQTQSSGELRNFQTPSVSVEFSIPRQELKAADAANWPSQLPLLIPLEARAELSKKGNAIDLAQAKVVWNSLRIQIGGRILLKEKGSPDIHLSLKTGRFSLADMAGLLPIAQKVGPKGEGDIDLKADGPADSPALAGQATLKGVSLEYQGQELKDLNASAKFTPQLITAQAQGVWNGGGFEMQGEARNYQKAPDIRFNGHLSELDLGALSQLQGASASAPAPKVETSASGAAPSNGGERPAAAPQSAAPAYAIHTAGKLTIDKITHPNFTAENSSAQWDLKDANLMSRITGEAKIQIGQGRFDDLKKVSQNGLLKALLLPVTVLQTITRAAQIPLLPRFDRVNFKEITGDYAFQNGVMTIRESHMDSKAAYMIATGNANLAQETLNMHVSTRLVGKLPGIAGPIGFKVGGTFSDPTYKLDVAAILKQPAVNKALQEGTKLLQDLFR